MGSRRNQPPSNKALQLTLDDALFRQFVAGLCDRLTAAESNRWQWDSAQESIRSDASRLAAQNAQLAEDPVGLQWIALRSMLLTLYRSLRSSSLDEERSLELLRESLTGPYRPQTKSYIRDRLGISQDARGEAFLRVSENFRSRG